MSKKIANQKFLALDLEMNQPSGHIIQVGIAVGSPDQPEAEWLTKKWYIDPNEPITEFITGLTGITNTDITEQAVSPQQCADEISKICDEHEPFINPVTWGGGDSFELTEFFNKESVSFKRFGRRWIDVKTLCVYLAFSHPTKNVQTSGSLRSYMQSYGMKFLGTAHRADVDAHNTLRLFFRLLERQGSLESAAQLFKQQA